jgi:hypothetical protein
VAGLLRPRLFPFGKLSKAKSAAHVPSEKVRVALGRIPQNLVQKA